MKLYISIFLFFSFTFHTLARPKLMVKDKISGKMRYLRIGKIVGLYSNKDTIQFNENYRLIAITDSIISLKNTNNHDTIEFLLSDVKQIQYKVNQQDSAPVAIGIGGALLILVSPFVGIEKGGYDFESAGLTLGIGVGLVGFTYLVTRGRKLKDYEIIGMKR